MKKYVLRFVLLSIGRMFDMKKKGMGLVGGIGVGMISAAALGLAGAQLMKNSKQVKRSAGKAIHAVGDFVDNVQYMFK